MTEDKEIGNRIMVLRNDRGFTRDYLAERAGITSKFLYEIEVRGKGFSTHTLLGLSSALGVSADYILSGESNPKYDKELIGLLEMFQPQDIENVKRLLEIVYKLAVEPEM